MARTSKQKLEMEDRRDKVMALARMGFSQRAIAKELGYSVGAVNRDIRKRLSDHAKTHEDTGKVRTMTVLRYEQLLSRWSHKADEDPKIIPYIITLVEKIAQYSGVAPAQALDVTSMGESIRDKIQIQLVRPDGEVEDITPSGSSPEVTVNPASIDSES